MSDVGHVTTPDDRNVRQPSLFHALRIAAARPFYWIGTAFVIVADALDPRPEGPNG